MLISADIFFFFFFLGGGWGGGAGAGEGMADMPDDVLGMADIPIFFVINTM